MGIRRNYHTSEGVVEKELTQKEIKELAKDGDKEAQLELTKQEWVLTTDLNKRIRLLAQFLGIESWQKEKE